MNIVDSHNADPIPNDIPSSIADIDFSFKSPLMDWFRVNRIEFEQAFSGLTRRNWEAVAVRATAAGIRNGRDRPVTRACCRQAWYRLTNPAATRTKSKDLARNHGEEVSPPCLSAQVSQTSVASAANETITATRGVQPRRAKRQFVSAARQEAE